MHGNDTKIEKAQANTPQSGDSLWTRPRPNGAVREWKAPRVRRIVSLFAEGCEMRPSRKLCESRGFEETRAKASVFGRREASRLLQSAKQRVCDARCPRQHGVGAKLSSRAILTRGAGTGENRSWPLTLEASTSIALQKAANSNLRTEESKTRTCGGGVYGDSRVVLANRYDCRSLRATCG